MLVPVPGATPGLAGLEDDERECRVSRRGGAVAEEDELCCNEALWCLLSLSRSRSRSRSLSDSSPVWRFSEEGHSLNEVLIEVPGRE